MDLPIEMIVNSRPWSRSLRGQERRAATTVPDVGHCVRSIRGEGRRLLGPQSQRTAMYITSRSLHPTLEQGISYIDMSIPRTFQSRRTLIPQKLSDLRFFQLFLVEVLRYFWSLTLIQYISELEAVGRSS